MPCGLKRFQRSKQSHFVTFTCYHRRVGFDSPERYDLFLQILERMRRRFLLCIYGYVVMPQHVHLLVNEAEHGLLADAIHYLKLSFAKGLGAGVFWQKGYYDRNVRHDHEFMEKLEYIHQNPVKRGLCAGPEHWKWSSLRHYAFGEKEVVEIESEWTARERERKTTGGAKWTLLVPG